MSSRVAHVELVDNIPIPVIQESYAITALSEVLDDDILVLRIVEG